MLLVSVEERLCGMNNVRSATIQTCTQCHGLKGADCSLSFNSLIDG